MTGADLIDLVLADYLSTTFPPDPAARLAGLRVVQPWLAVQDPRRHVLDRAVADAQAVRIHVVNS